MSRRHIAKLVNRVGPAPVVNLPWFKKDDYAWGKHVQIPGYPRPLYPQHITQAEFPGFFDEMARYKMWRQRKRAGVPHPALGLWAYGRLPQWVISVSKAQDAAGHIEPPPQPPTPTPAPNVLLLARAQKVVFTAWRPAWHGRNGRLAITADVNVAGDPARHLAMAQQARKEAHDAGHEVAAWANQSQVGIGNVMLFHSQIGADYIIWQAETIGELADVGINPDGSLRPGSPMDLGPLVLIGNANAWTNEQREAAAKLIHYGALAFIQETYTNEGDPWPESYGTQGVPAASICLGVGWGRYPYLLTSYKEHTPAGLWPSICDYIAETTATLADLPY